MPIRRDLKPLYPPNWKALSLQVRFARARGACQHCGRPHGQRVRILPGGRWFDTDRGLWRDGRGREARYPDLLEAITIRTTQVVLAAAHLDHNPANNRLANLRALCQRCHIIQDSLYHLRQRRLTYRRRMAIGDLFEGHYHHRPNGQILTAPGSVARKTILVKEKRLIHPITRRRLTDFGEQDALWSESIPPWIASRQNPSQERSRSRYTPA